MFETKLVFCFLNRRSVDWYNWRKTIVWEKEIDIAETKVRQTRQRYASLDKK